MRAFYVCAVFFYCSICWSQNNPCNTKVYTTFLNGFSFVPQIEDYVLVIDEQFDGNDLDESIWSPFFSWGPIMKEYPKSLAYYKPENLEVSNGTLKITTKYEPGEYCLWGWENGIFNGCISKKHFDFTSGVISSKVNFAGGRFEIRCKQPLIDGSFPAFWLRGCNTEIDVFEFYRGKNIFGNLEPLHKSNSSISTSLHHYPPTGLNCIDYTDDDNCPDTQWHKTSTAYSVDFHVFAVQWDEYYVYWYVDRTLLRVDPKYYRWNYRPASGNYRRNNFWPDWEHQMVLIVNNDVHKDAAYSGVFPQTMEIDYIKVYKRRRDCEELIEVCDDFNRDYYQDNFILGGDVELSNGSCPLNLETFYDGTTSGKVFKSYASNSVTMNPGFQTFDTEGKSYLFEAKITSCDNYSFKSNNEGEEILKTVEVINDSFESMISTDLNCEIDFFNLNGQRIISLSLDAFLNHDYRAHLSTPSVYLLQARSNMKKSTFIKYFAR